MNKWVEILKTNNFIGVKQYIKKDGDINDESENGESVLACAIRYHCDDDLIQLLINSGADIFNYDNEGVSIFDIAITYNNFSVVKHIMDNGIDINTTTRRSRFTPLMCASCYGHKKIVKFLLDAGANKEARDIKGFSATDFARKMNKKSVLELLEYDKDAPENKIHTR